MSRFNYIEYGGLKLEFDTVKHRLLHGEHGKFSFHKYANLDILHAAIVELKKSWEAGGQALTREGAHTDQEAQVLEKIFDKLEADELRKMSEI